MTGKKAVDLVLTSDCECASCGSTSVTAYCPVHGEVEVLQLGGLGDKPRHGELCGVRVTLKCDDCDSEEIIL